jgi:hypothetical protein
MPDQDPIAEMLRRLDRPVAPTAAFARTLEQRLLGEIGQAATSERNEMSQSTPVSRSWLVTEDARPRRRAWLPVLEIAAILVIALGIGGAVLGSRGLLPGQSGNNHGATSAAFPIIPDPSECTVAPRTAEEVRAIVRDYSQGPPPDQTPSATPDRTLQHHPASAEVAAQIEAAYREWIACANAGDFLRMYALETDGFIGQGGSIDVINKAPTPVPSGERLEILDFSYSREFSDGRAGAVAVIGSVGSAAVIQPVFFLFEKHGDRWLVDASPEGWAPDLSSSDVTVVTSDGAPTYESSLTPTPTAAVYQAVTPVISQVDLEPSPTVTPVSYVILIPTITPTSGDRP